MKTLKEINEERAKIIDEAVDNFYHNPSLARGIPYTPEELSQLTGGLIPAKNFKDVMTAGLREVKDNAYKRWSGARYYLYGRIRCKFVESQRKLTYKVYDEKGDLIDEYTRYKDVIKAEII